MAERIIRISLNALVLFILAAVSLSAQSTKRGFKLLEKLEYQKSEDLFKEALAENSKSAAALFGLALVMADTNSPGFNLIDAWEYASAAKPNLESLTTEELEYIGEYFYNTESRHISRPVKKKIEYAVETIEAKLIKYIREENNLNMVYEVLEKFPDFRHYDNVIHIRNQLEFRKYEKQNTLDGYLEFLQKFPDAAQVDKAIRYRNKLAFEKAGQVNTAEAYKHFMNQYPQAAEYSMALRKLHAVAFQEAKKLNTMKAFDDYMTAYPDALEISEARLIQKQLLYEYAKKIQTLQAYNEFIRRYPDGQQYIDIFNLKSLDNGMRFLAAHPVSSNNIQWVRSFEEEENDELSACIAVDTLNAYVVGGTVFRSDTGSTDAWIIKVNADGKMLWNKYVGEEFNDEVNLLTINNHNEILGAGYTYLGRDSSSAESWLFKLGPDGQKIWSKRLGKMNINTLHVNHLGSLYLGGYLIDDSLRRKYSMIVLNDNGKRLWSRTYTGTGAIVKVAECPDKKMLIAGTNWRAKIDPKGYLLWEAPFNVTDSITSAQLLARGEIGYLGFRNKTKLVFIRTSADNKQLLEKELAFPDIPMQVNALISNRQNQLIVLITFQQHQSINWINPLSGEITSSTRLPFGIEARSIITDQKDNLLLVAANGEIIVVRNNGSAF